MKYIVFFVIVFLSITNTKQFDLESCRHPLGIETGKILDSAFSSSSHADEHSIASKARIRSKSKGWCPANKISSTTYEYLQIDFENLTVLTLIELQGKFSIKPNEYYADAFRLEYRRTKEQQWIKYKDFSGQYILSGNSNNYIPTIRDIVPSIIAQHIRIIPIVTSSIPKHVCLRLELYGCSYSDGIVSYSIPQGNKGESDEIYDGMSENGILKDGLGQLTDGIFAADDHRYDWIGWKRNTSLNLLFYFDKIRNFTAIRIHTSNLFTNQIFLFHSIRIANCDKSHYQSMDILIPSDSTNTSARLIQILLSQRNKFITNCLNLTIRPHETYRWIFISEIEFDSKPIDPSINSLSIIHYWHWLFFVVSLVLLAIILLLIHQIQTSSKFFYRKFQYLWKKTSRKEYRHQLIMSTTNSSDLNSTINPYLTATTNPYSSVDMNMNSIEGPCGNSTYECSNDLPSMIIRYWNCEQFILGQSYSKMRGQFGTIFRGYLYLRHPYDILKPVLIKILTSNDPIQKNSFDKEHELLNYLHHPNLVQFYGYIFEQNYALIEHSDLGDLYTCLSTSENISKNLRLYMITQLSNALRYLELQHVIHRDISARNCLIYPNYEIKLTNSAFASEQFYSHYYLVNQVRLPIRWMSPESVITNEFTFQSDVWSFGITLWEVMTDCQTLPYCFLNDEEVYENLKLIQGLHLPKPECLSKEVIDLMLECWRPMDERPNFEEIYNFFSKRLEGIHIV